VQPGNPGAPREKKTSFGLIAIVVIAGGSLVCVAFIGILAAIAIPAFVRYTRQAKTSEARSNIRAMALSEASYYEERTSLVTSAGPVPPSPGPTKQLPAFSSDPGFSALGFAPSDPVYFSYAITPDPAVPGGAILRANGDLDGDGSLSTFEVHCRANGDCDPVPMTTNEFE